MAESLKRVYWTPNLVKSMKTYVKIKDEGKFVKHVKIQYPTSLGLILNAIRQIALMHGSQKI